MQSHKNRSQKPFRKSALWRSLTFPFRRWKAWRIRMHTVKMLRNMSDERLKDIGLNRSDLDQFK
ncbi:DUF1127 domain-containing protein [Pectobacterium cacticida]|uniref:DUF1127 domain-containing protein n=1 Tax=Pectobacterium cacticida TaxID=69221 RepID=UPI002FEFEDDB